MEPRRSAWRLGGRATADARFWAGFWAIVAIAAALRFWSLGAAPIWMDEAFTVLVARLPVRAILFDHVDLHPPLVYLVEKLWSAVTPDPAWARAPFALLGVLGVAGLILAVADLVSRRAGLIAGLFLALSTGHVYFSQDARTYPLLTFALVLAAWGAIGGLGEAQGDRPVKLGRRAYAALYLVGGTLAIYSQVLGLILLAVVNLGCLAARYLVWGRRERRPYFRSWLAVNLILLVLALPWLLQIPLATGAFVGLGQAQPGAAPWFFRNAVGFAGLPPALEKLMDLVLLGVLAAGAVAAWRAGRRGFALVGLGLVLVYPALVTVISAAAPMLATRVFLPAALGVAALVGCAMAAATARSRSTGWIATGLLLAAMGASTLLERQVRTKYEDLPAALAFAAESGLPDAPVLACGFFTAGSVWAAAPARPAYILLPDGVLRFDAGFIQATRMSLGRLMLAGAVEVNDFLGGGYLVAGGVDQALAGHDGALLITQPCEPGVPERMRGALAAVGFRPLATRAFPGGRDGQVIIQRGETVAELYSRADRRP